MQDSELKKLRSALEDKDKTIKVRLIHLRFCHVFVFKILNKPKVSIFFSIDEIKLNLNERLTIRFEFINV